MKGTAFEKLIANYDPSATRVSENSVIKAWWIENGKPTSTDILESGNVDECVSLVCKIVDGLWNE